MKNIFSVLCLSLYSLVAAANTNYIPPQAFLYKDTIKNELDTYFPYIPEYNYLPSLAEHESCISLKHKRCWNPSSALRSSREVGIGLFQVTKTFREDGSVRFDTLTEMASKYKQELKDAKWETIHTRPDIQIRMAILQLRGLYKSLYDVENALERLKMVDAAYNGGLAGLQRERRACAMAKNCSSDIWYNNVERYCLKSKKPLYGNRSACDINRYHVKDVFENKLPKYKRLYFVES